MNKKHWIIISIAVVLVVAASVAVAVRVSKKKQEEAYKRGAASTKGLEFGLNLGISNEAIAPIAKLLSFIF